MVSNDNKILEQLKLGNPSSYKELFDLYYMPLSIYSLKFCDSFELAEDIVQELFVKLWDEKLCIPVKKHPHYKEAKMLIAKKILDTEKFIYELENENRSRSEEILNCLESKGVSNCTELATVWH